MKHSFGYLRLIAFIIFVALIAWVIYHYYDQIDPQNIREFIKHYGMAAPLIFILLYIVAVICFLPGSLITITGGLIFGPVFGTLYNIIGATIGATIAFLISRHFSGDWFTKRINKKLSALNQGIEKEGWRFVAFTRLVPLVPFNLLNYALGLTNIRLTEYIIASFIFMLPTCFAYTYLGHIGAEAAAGKHGLVRQLLLAIALLAAIVFIPRFIKRIRNRSK